MKKQLEDKEAERQEALERERQMALKYKELDIFKLDVIARELKALDNELGYLGKEVKMMQTDVNRMRHMEDQSQMGQHSDKMMGQCVDLRAHIRDVINKCLSETQKLHIGVAIDDPERAGVLQDGGKMAGYVLEEVDIPDHGNSKAGKLRQADEMKGERKGSPPPKRGASPRPG